MAMVAELGSMFEVPAASMLALPMMGPSTTHMIKAKSRFSGFALATDRISGQEQSTFFCVDIS